MPIFSLQKLLIVDTVPYFVIRVHDGRGDTEARRID